MNVSKCCRADLIAENGDDLGVKDGTSYYICAMCRKPTDPASVSQELQLASNEELIIALMSRFEHGVFSAMKPAADGGAVTYRRWKGNSATCAGLAFQTAHAVTHDYFEQTRTCDDKGELLD